MVQTLGYRKDQDWITQAWFKRTAGRSSASVSSAIDHLVKHRLIVVTDESGQTLASCRSRQLCRGKLFYALGQALSYPQPGQTPFRNTKKTGVQKVNGTGIEEYINKDKQGQLSTGRVNTGWVKAGEVGSFKELGVKR